MKRKLSSYPKKGWCNRNTDLTSCTRLFAWMLLILVFLLENRTDIQAQQRISEVTATLETNGGPLVWAEEIPAGATLQGWGAAGVSRDRSKTTAAVFWNGRMYLNSAGVWAETQPQGDVNGKYNDIAVSANGAVMLTGQGSGGLFVYQNGSWTRQPFGNLGWGSFAISDDGSTMVASADNYGGSTQEGQIYKYSGGAWTRLRPAGPLVEKNITKVAMSADGSKILVIGGGWNYVGQDQRRLYYYDGTAWTETTPTASPYDRKWNDIAISADGLVMYACDGSNSLDGKIYRYSDGSWTESNSTGTWWSSIATNAGGNIAIAGDFYGGTVKKYQNGSWTSITPAGAGWEHRWFNIAMSGDGSKILMAAEGASATKGGLYKGTQSVADSISQTSAVVNGRIINIGSSQPTVRGICYGSLANPDITALHTIEMGAFGTGSFSAKLTGLSFGTLYHARAYATNSAGTSYGDDITFMTSPVFPAALTIASGPLLLPDSASMTGNITDIGGDSCTSRGVLHYIYSGTDKMLGASGVSSVSKSGIFGTGTWTDTIAGLSANKRYSARSFAVNMADTSYSSRLDFYSAANIPAAPGVSLPTSTTLSVVVNANSNPVASTFAIQDSISGKYVWANGSLGDTAIWQTQSVWGTKIVTGLSVGVTYKFRVKAKNGGGAQTAFGPTTSGMPVGPPSVNAGYGPAWQAPVSPGVPSFGTFKSVAVAADSMKMIAAAYNGRVYLSDDSGASWTETSPSGTAQNKLWTGVAVSADGQKMMVCAMNGRLYTSVNAGLVWNDRVPIGANIDRDYMSPVISNDGSTWLITMMISGTSRMFKSVNNGADWTEIRNEPSNGMHIAASEDGSVILAAVLTTGDMKGKMYQSQNGGTSWTETMPTGISENKQYTSVSVSDDGSTMITSVFDGRLYVSNDTALTWNEVQPVGDIDKQWEGVEVAADKTSMFAAFFQGPLYRFYDNEWIAQPTFDVTGDGWSISASRNGECILVGCGTDSLHRAVYQLTSNTSKTSTIVYGKIVSLNGASANNRGFIYYPYSNTDKIIGQSDVSNINENGTFIPGNYLDTVTGLSVNTRYNFRTHATSTFGTGYSTRVDFWTLANTPSVPSLSAPTTTTLNLAINANGNPASTTYAIFDTVTSKFVQANGTLGLSAVWQTEALWEVNATNTAKTISGLSENVKYAFKVKAKNGSDAETDYSSKDSLYTLAKVPTAPTVNTATTTSLNVAINGNANPAATEFAIQENVGSKYVQSDGTLGVSAVWQTEADWETDATNTAKTVTGLSVNTQYTFKVKARNGNNVETVFSGTTSLYTHANVPDTPTVNNPTATTLDVAVNVNSNPAATVFAIQDSVNGTFVQANGTRSATAVWQTATNWGTKTITGLSSGTIYYFRVKARNGGDVESVYGYSASTYPYSLPTVSTQAASNIDTTFATGNGSITSITGDTVTVRGMIHYAYTGTDQVIGDAGVIIKADTGRYGTSIFSKPFNELSVNSRYSQRSFAKNAAGISYGTRVDFFTLANAPACPTVINPTATSLDVAVNVNNNPLATEFAIQDSVNGTYVQANGTRAATEVWQTATTWGTKTVSGLSTGVTYYFRVIARNGDYVETAFSYTTAQNTCSNPTNAGEINGEQTICYNTEAAELGSVSEASDYGGTLQYQWQSNTTSSTYTFDDIIGAASNTYSPGAMTQTSWFRRLARVSCKDDWTGAAESNVVKITVDPLPEASAGGSTTICVSSEAIVSGASSANGDIEWTSNGSGSITDETSLSPTYTPAAGDAGNSVILTMTVTSNNTCGPATATATYTVYVDPLTVGGSISGNDSTIVHTSTGDLSLTGQTGDVLQWEKKLDAGDWEIIPGTAEATYSDTPVTVGAWSYRALVQSGVCSSTYSAGYVVEVIPDIPDYFTLTSPGTAITGSASGNFVVSLFDQYDNPTYCRANTNFNLSTSSNGSSRIFTPGSPLQLANGTYTNTFTYLDSKAGTHNITATYVSGSAGLTGETLTVPITITLPVPWVQINLGASNGTTEFFPEVNAGTYKPTAQGVSAPKSDVMNFVFQSLCGNGTVIARLSDVANGGWAGVMMRESNAPGAKTVLFKTKLYNPMANIGVRSTTNGNISNTTQNIPSIHWMKIQRTSSNTFKIYTSYDGTSWTRRYTATVAMNNCINGGFFTENAVSGRTTTAWIDHAEVVGYLKETEEVITEINDPNQFEVDVYPNPANDRIWISIAGNEEKVKVSLINASGLVVETTEMNTMDAEYPLSHIKPGLYLLRFERNGIIVSKRLVVL